MSTRQPFRTNQRRRLHLGAALAFCIGILAGLPSVAASGPAVHVEVDPRVELFSILFRLAGNAEYNQGKVEAYDKAIDAHFAPFREHPAVQTARRLREEKGISFDDVMSLAIHVTDTVELREKIPLDSPESPLTPHWNPEDARALLAQTRTFVREARFEELLKAQRPLHELTARRMRQFLDERVDLTWFGRFFGEPPQGQLFVIPGLVNGGSNYGLKVKRPGEPEDLYAVMGVWLTDEAGQPRFDDDMVAAIVIHEFSHSFVNHVVEIHRQALVEFGEPVFEAVAPQMRRQAYGNWKTMVDESLVRAAVVRYVVAHGGSEAERREIEQQKKRSFLWMGELSALLAKYESSRDRYPTFASFMPEVLRYFQDLAPRASGMVRESAAGERSSGNPGHEPGVVQRTKEIS